MPIEDIGSRDTDTLYKSHGVLPVSPGNPVMYVIMPAKRQLATRR